MGRLELQVQKEGRKGQGVGEGEGQGVGEGEGQRVGKGRGRGRRRGGGENLWLPWEGQGPLPALEGAEGGGGSSLDGSWEDHRRCRQLNHRGTLLSQRPAPSTPSARHLAKSPDAADPPHPHRLSTATTGCTFSSSWSRKPISHPPGKDPHRALPSPSFCPAQEEALLCPHLVTAVSPLVAQTAETPVSVDVLERLVESN